MKKILRNILANFGFEISKIKDVLPDNLPKPLSKKTELFNRYIDYLTFEDFEENEITQIQDVLSFTMTGPLRIVSLIRAVEYVIANNIQGAFVECGVWKGGSMMVIANTLMKHGVYDRDLYLYDTFEGMSEPSDLDVSFDNKEAKNLLTSQLQQKENGDNIWCYSALEEVRENLIRTGYNQSKIHFVKGKVEDTIPSKMPKSISLLRLDTDWYESTMHELVFLYPILSEKGVLIIDDYGQWMGQKKAVDEYIKLNSLNIFLSRIDFSSRIAIKIS